MMKHTAKNFCIRAPKAHMTLSDPLSILNLFQIELCQSMVRWTLLRQRTNVRIPTQRKMNPVTPAWTLSMRDHSPIHSNCVFHPHLSCALATLARQSDLRGTRIVGQNKAGSGCPPPIWTGDHENQGRKERVLCRRDDLFVIDDLDTLHIV